MWFLGRSYQCSCLCHTGRVCSQPTDQPAHEVGEWPDINNPMVGPARCHTIYDWHAGNTWSLARSWHNGRQRLTGMWLLFCFTGVLSNVIDGTRRAPDLGYHDFVRHVRWIGLLGGSVTPGYSQDVGAGWKCVVCATCYVRINC